VKVAERDTGQSGIGGGEKGQAVNRYQYQKAIVTEIKVLAPCLRGKNTEL
jgi:hypothetical protein